MPTYTESQVSEAISAIKAGQSIRSASQQWGIPFTTLYRRYHGSTTRRLANEPCQRLSIDQERHLANWIIAQEALGQPLTHAQIKSFASRILQTGGDFRPLGKHWIQHFLARNPDCKTKRSKGIDLQRLSGSSTEVIQAWFQRLTSSPLCNVLPEDRWNMDETGIMEGFGQNGLVVGSSNTKDSLKKASKDHSWTSIIEVISATGQTLNPLVIFKGKDIQQQWFPDRADLLASYRGWRFVTSENGWTSNEIALEWLTKVFIPESKPPVDRPRLLVLDGHKTHASEDFQFTCYANNILCFYLPPHTSHILQPLDLAVFSPLKTAYRRALGDVALQRNACTTGKRVFLRCYATARERAFTVKNIQSGWRSGGLWPVNIYKPLHNPLRLEERGLRSPPKSDNTQASQPNLSLPPKPTVEVGSSYLATPLRGQEVHSLTHQLAIARASQPTARAIFRKVRKAVDLKNTQIASLQAKVLALEEEVERLRPTKKQKVQIDPNERFATIEQVMRTKEAIENQVEEPVHSRDYIFEEMCFEWQS
ncbi:hypothetical protein VTK73DRAFT_4356 [Phialemonium thermophilum]|uniref:HTH CENPB-type domain-containing protein n=1 Tax=Phialemonium thermophilum TaxID=223376 RepID=A0ABR3V9A9_9PEZI